MEYLTSERKEELQKNARAMSRGYRGSREGAPTVPTWDNLSIKTSKHVMSYKPREKVRLGVHTSKKEREAGRAEAQREQARTRTAREGSKSQGGRDLGGRAGRDTKDQMITMVGMLEWESH